MFRSTTKKMLKGRVPFFSVEILEGPLGDGTPASSKRV
jgi:hypothetical protein